MSRDEDDQGLSIKDKVLIFVSIVSSLSLLISLLFKQVIFAPKQFETDDVSLRSSICSIAAQALIDKRCYTEIFDQSQCKSMKKTSQIFNAPGAIEILSVQLIGRDLCKILYKDQKRGSQWILRGFLLRTAPEGIWEHRVTEIREIYTTEEEQKEFLSKRGESK